MLIPLKQRINLLLLHTADFDENILPLLVFETLEITLSVFILHFHNMLTLVYYVSIPITVTNEAIETLPLAADKTNKVLSK